MVIKNEYFILIILQIVLLSFEYFMNNYKLYIISYISSFN